MVLIVCGVARTVSIAIGQQRTGRLLGPEGGEEGKAK